MALNKKPTGYVQLGTPEHALAESLSKSAWIDLYIDVYRQAFGDMTDVSDVLADAYTRLLILEEKGIREHSASAAAAWRKWGKRLK